MIGRIKRIVKGVLRQFAPVVKVEVTSLSPNQLLKGRSALITGGTSGIGFQIARSFLYAGARVIITGRNQKRVDEACQKLLQECEDWKDNIHGIEMDVTKINQLEQSFQDMIKSVGGIDILVNNAGITRDQLILRMKTEDFDAVINTNLKGTYLCMKQASRLMMKQKSGHIISLSSVVGVIGNAGQVNYAASKAGVIGMTMSLARELGPRGVTVNAVAPGFIETDMTEVLSDEIKVGLKASIPLGTLGHVEDVAKTIAFLASDDAKYITGQTIHVDGGMAM